MIFLFIELIGIYVYILKDNYLLMFFLLHLSLAVIALFISIKGSKGVDKLGLIIVSASYVLIVFARPGLGVDETTYRVAYETYLSNPNMVEFEYSFKTLFYFFKIAEVTPEVFNNTMCCLYIMLMTILVLFTVQSSFKTLCLLIFLFSAVSLDFIFNAYRQGFAFIFVFASLIFYKGNKRLLSALFIIIAIGFHWSSIFIPMLMFCFRIFSKNRVKQILSIVILLTTVGFIVPLGILSTLNKVLTTIPFKNIYIEKISFYLTTSESSIYALNLFGRLPLLVNTLLLLVICRLFLKYIDYFWIKLVTAVGIYCFIFMEMSFSFRNYYWLLPFFPFVICNGLTNYRNLNGTNNVQYIMFIISGHIMLSLLTYYTSPLIPLLFLGSNS